jgi:D-alanyl-lipoteichoic acid acyltransferase DltB (MBOAT superfamily)
VNFLSSEFLILAFTTVLLYFVVSSTYRRVVLLAASLIFYAAVKLEYLGLIIASSLIDYLAALAMFKYTQKTRRAYLLGVSVFLNLSLLIAFKYWNFFATGIETLSSTEIFIHDWVVPVGLSFYTLQTMGYTIDVYREKFKAERNYGVFLLYTAFFPQLVAGPIERASKLMPQLKNLALPSITQVQTGILLILWGLFIKTVVADNLAPAVQQAYTEDQASLLLWGFSATAMVRVYCDFWGYTEIARGIANFFGVQLSINFRQPFLAKNLAGFWTRWHITLTRWLMDYVQVPLMKRFRNEPSRSFVAMFTLVLIGLWHGASWNFIFFGFFQGVVLIVWRHCENIPYLRQIILNQWVSRALLLVTLMISAPMFYISDTAQLQKVLTSMISFQNSDIEPLIHLNALLIAVIGFTLVLCHDLLAEYRGFKIENIIQKSTPIRLLVAGFLFLSVLLAGKPSGGEFVYFAF